ncbi:MAG: tetratricopeptide repeat protein [Desulfobulbaceae bacterium]|nr:tetratricopeptide repeat protein [Desulfobulbaceae bacterium]
MSDQIQPMSSIVPMEECNQAGGGQSLSDYDKGKELLGKGEYAEAAINFHNALKGYEEAGDRFGVANASDRLGDVCLAKNEYRMALDNYERAIDICQKAEDSWSVLSLNKKMAKAHEGLGEIDKALELIFDVSEHYSLTRNPKGTVETLEEIARLYILAGEKVKAADAYRTAASIHRKFKHNNMAAELDEKAAALDGN